MSKGSKALAELNALVAGQMAAVEAVDALLSSTSDESRIDPEVRRYLSWWNKHLLPELRGWARAIEENDMPAKPSEMLDGFRQGAREYRYSLGVLGDADRRAIWARACEAGGPVFVDLFRSDPVRLERLAQKGSIRSESEYHLARHRLDEIEGVPGHEEETRRWWKLLGEYELRAARRGIT